MSSASDIDKKSSFLNSVKNTSDFPSVPHLIQLDHYCPTDLFTILEPQNQEVGESYIIQKRSCDGFWSTKVLKGSVGDYCYTTPKKDFTAVCLDVEKDEEKLLEALCNESFQGAGWSAARKTTTQISPKAPIFLVWKEEASKTFLQSIFICGPSREPISFIRT